MIYLDSNVFIYSLIYEDTLGVVQKAEYYLKQVVTGEIAGCTCTLTWDEVFYNVLKSTGLNEAIRAGKSLLSFPNLKFLNVDFELIAKAHELAAERKLKPRDAIHAASAIEYCNGEIISNDAEFDCVDQIRRTF